MGKSTSKPLFLNLKKKLNKIILHYQKPGVTWLEDGGTSTEPSTRSSLGRCADWGGRGQPIQAVPGPGRQSRSWVQASLMTWYIISCLSGLETKGKYFMITCNIYIAIFLTGNVKIF